MRKEKKDKSTRKLVLHNLLIPLALGMIVGGMIFLLFFKQ